VCETSSVISTAHLRFCSERSQLLDAWDNAAANYATAVEELTLKMSGVQLEAYERKWAEVEHARLDAQNAREALMAHRKEHGC
jgi:hypothetical protein